MAVWDVIFGVLVLVLFFYSVWIMAGKPARRGRVSTARTSSTDYLFAIAILLLLLFWITGSISSMDWLKSVVLIAGLIFVIFYSVLKIRETRSS